MINKYFRRFKYDRRKYDYFLYRIIFPQFSGNPISLSNCSRVRCTNGQSRFSGFCPYLHYTVVFRHVNKTCLKLTALQVLSCLCPVHFFVISMVARYSIFKRLSSDGNTVLLLVTFRSWRLNPSMNTCVHNLLF